jgi:hypothetical protein
MDGADSVNQGIVENLESSTQVANKPNTHRAAVSGGTGGTSGTLASTAR